MKFLYTSCGYPVTVEDNVYPAILVAGIVLSSLAVALRIANRWPADWVQAWCRRCGCCNIASEYNAQDSLAQLTEQAHAIAITVIGFLCK